MQSPHKSYCFYAVDFDFLCRQVENRQKKSKIFLLKIFFDFGKMFTSNQEQEKT